MADCITIVLDFLRRHNLSMIEAVFNEEVSLRQQLNDAPLVPWNDSQNSPPALTSGRESPFGPSYHWSTKTECMGYMIDYMRRHQFSRVEVLLREEISLEEQLNGSPLVPSNDDLDPVVSTSGKWQHQRAQIHHDVEVVPDNRAHDKLVTQRTSDTVFTTKLLSEMAELHVDVETLTDELANKDGALQAIKIKDFGTHEDSSTRLGLIRRQGLRQDGEVGEKGKLEHKMRQWQESKHEILSKILPPQSPMHPKSPAHDQLCPSPSTKSVKRALGADSTFLTPRSRFSNKAGSAVSQADVSFLDKGLSFSTPHSTHSLAARLDSESLTPFQQFRQKNSDFQMTLVKEYLSVLNTATRQELLQLKGIGSKRATDILELREKCKEPFKELKDLKNIGLSKREVLTIINGNIVQKITFSSP